MYRVFRGKPRGRSRCRLQRSRGDCNEGFVMHMHRRHLVRTGPGVVDVVWWEARRAGTYYEILGEKPDKI